MADSTPHPPEVPAALPAGQRRFVMPPPPRGWASTPAGGDGEFSIVPGGSETTAPPDAAPQIFIEPVQPRRRCRSDTMLMIAILTALAVVAGGLAALVLLSG